MATKEQLEAIKSLPADWWKTENACLTFADLFNLHTLVLLISYKTTSRPEKLHSTGFLLEYQNQLLWITAGHVVENIQSSLNNAEIHIERLFWLDSHENPKAGATVIARRNLDPFIAEDKDFGAVKITGLERESLLANPKTKVFTPLSWKGLSSAKPEGYYLVGFPNEWTELKELGKEGKQVRKQFKANIACLPMEAIPYEDLPEPAREIWKDRGAFYGLLLTIDGSTLPQPEKIGGMSGGPIISIERTPDGQMRYRLAGIQSSWLPSQRLIKAVSMLQIEQLYLRTAP